MVHNNLEKGVIEEFFEEYRLKYVRKLESWQEIIDMYAEQELQKAKEESQYRKQKNKQQKERTTMLKVTASQRELLLTGVETEIEQTDHVTSVFGNLPSTRVPAISVPFGAVTHLVSSTCMVPSPSIEL